MQQGEWQGWSPMAMLGGRIVTRYKRDGEQYDVVVQTEGTQRSTPDDIDRLFVRGRNDAMIPLASLVKLREVVATKLELDPATAEFADGKVSTGGKAISRTKVPRPVSPLTRPICSSSA